LYYAWHGRTYAAWESYRGGSQKLRSWGVRSGVQQIIFVIEAKGSKIAADLDRNGITGWSEEEAQEEVAANMPAEIRNFMDSWEGQHYDDAHQLLMVKGFVADMRPLHINLPPNDGDGDGIHSPRTPREGGGGGGGGRIRSNPRRLTSDPSYAFVDEAELGNTPVAFDVNSHRILLNKDCSHLKFLEDAPSIKIKSGVKAWLAAMTICQFSSYFSTFQELPGEHEMMSGLLASIASARAFVNNPNLLRLPKPPKAD